MDDFKVFIETYHNYHRGPKLNKQSTNLLREYMIRSRNYSASNLMKIPEKTHPSNSKLTTPARAETSRHAETSRQYVLPTKKRTSSLSDNNFTPIPIRGLVPDNEREKNVNKQVERALPKLRMKPRIPSYRVPSPQKVQESLMKQKSTLPENLEIEPWSPGVRPKIFNGLTRMRKNTPFIENTSNGEIVVKDQSFRSPKKEYKANELLKRRKIIKSREKQIELQPVIQPLQGLSKLEQNAMMQLLDSEGTSVQSQRKRKVAVPNSARPTKTYSITNIAIPMNLNLDEESREIFHSHRELYFSSHQRVPSIPSKSSKYTGENSPGKDDRNYDRDSLDSFSMKSNEDSFVVYLKKQNRYYV